MLEGFQRMAHGGRRWWGRRETSLGECANGEERGADDTPAAADKLPELVEGVRYVRTSIVLRNRVLAIAASAATRVAE